MSESQLRCTSPSVLSTGTSVQLSLDFTASSSAVRVFGPTAAVVDGVLQLVVRPRDPDDARRRVVRVLPLPGQHRRERREGGEGEPARCAAGGGSREERGVACGGGGDQLMNCMYAITMI